MKPLLDLKVVAKLWQNISSSFKRTSRWQILAKRVAFVAKIFAVLVGDIINLNLFKYSG